MRTTAKKPPVILSCESCGRVQEAGCQCGKPYIPLRPGERAKAAVAANPAKANRVIADGIGVDERTVRRAKGTKAAKAAKGANSEQSGPMLHDEDAGVGPDPAQQRWENSLGAYASDGATMQSYWTRIFGPGWQEFTVPSDLFTLATEAQAAWTTLLRHLEQHRRTKT